MSMTIRTRVAAVSAAIALGTSGAFAQSVSRHDPGAHTANLPPVTDTSNQDRAAVAPGTGLPPGADRAFQPPESTEPAPEATPSKMPDPAQSRGSEPSFLFMVR